MTHRLLLADDSITIQKVVELVLAEEDFDIRAASNGEEALAIIAQFKPNVVLADTDMPMMNGYQLCEKIKANPDTKHVPVILLAGAFEPLDEELAKNVGAEDYIVKPFESQELISKINAAITVEEMAEATPVEGFSAEAVEGVLVEEDLWAMEDLTSEPASAGELLEEASLEETPFEETASEEAISFGEQLEEEIVSEKTVSKAMPPEEVVGRSTSTAPYYSMPKAEFLSEEKTAGILREAVSEKIEAVFSSVNVNEILRSSFEPFIKDSAEKVLWEVVPQLVEKLLKEMLQGSLAAITKEVEKVIWETVPDLAESMISKEIHRIKSEL